MRITDFVLNTSLSMAQVVYPIVFVSIAVLLITMLPSFMQKSAWWPLIVVLVVATLLSAGYFIYFDEAPV